MYLTEKQNKLPPASNNNINIARLPCISQITVYPESLPTLRPTYPDFTHCSFVLASNLTIAGGWPNLIRQYSYYCYQYPYVVSLVELIISLNIPPQHTTTSPVHPSTLTLLPSTVLEPFTPKLEYCT
jgi:hypothetical protein